MDRIPIRITQRGQAAEKELKACYRHQLIMAIDELSAWDGFTPRHQYNMNQTTGVLVIVAYPLDCIKRY